jgi:alginate O-acetyltransferase complex protein AlgI
VSATALAWSAAIAATVAAERLAAAQPPFVRMLVLIAAVMLGMKLVVAVGARTPLPAVCWLVFALWPGMDPRTFARRAPRPGGARLARDGALCALSGAALLGLANHIELPRTATEGAVFVASSLIVHFGAFALFAAALRVFGFPAERLFRAPWRARSLAEFWTLRWNLGFVQMTALAIQRPLRARLGHGPATALSFLFSGLLHECAITLPLRHGFGRPLAYFALQAAAALVERRLGLRSRLWTAAWLVLPLPLLFPAAFRAMVTAVLAP